MTEQETKRVDPINTREVGGETVEEEYAFDKVHVEDIPADYHNQYVDFKKGKEKVRWEYPGKCPILIDEDGVIVKADAPREEAQNQAYFALSMLSDAGYVSRFQKL